MAGYAMNDIEVAVKYGAEHTVNILMEELEENGTDSCVNLLIEMDNLLKTGLYDRYIERTNLAMEVNT